MVGGYEKCNWLCQLVHRDLLVMKVLSVCDEEGDVLSRHKEILD